jgi:flagellar export protein FliJ
MAAFRFKFESVLRYRRSRRDLCLQYLAQVLADDRALVVKREGLQKQRQVQLDELRVLGRIGKFSVDGATARRYYVGQLTSEIRLVDHNRSVVAGQIELCRKALAQAEKEVKVFERLKEKQAAHARHEQLHREGLELEEAWQAIHFQEFVR